MHPRAEMTFLQLHTDQFIGAVEAYKKPNHPLPLIPRPGPFWKILPPDGTKC